MPDLVADLYQTTPVRSEALAQSTNKGSFSSSQLEIQAYAAAHSAADGRVVVPECSLSDYSKPSFPLLLPCLNGPLSKSIFENLGFEISHFPGNLIIFPGKFDHFPLDFIFDQ